MRLNNYQPFVAAFCLTVILITGCTKQTDEGNNPHNDSLSEKESHVAAWAAKKIADGLAVSDNDYRNGTIGEFNFAISLLDNETPPEVLHILFRDYLEDNRPSAADPYHGRYLVIVPHVGEADPTKEDYQKARRGTVADRILSCYDSERDDAENIETPIATKEELQELFQRFDYDPKKVRAYRLAKEKE